MSDIFLSAEFSVAPLEQTIALLSEFTENGGGYALVLDDLHRITNEEILRSLPYILRRLSHSFVTLILTRSEPDDLFLDFVDKGEAALVTAENLTFSPEEVRGYYADFGHFLTAKEAQSIHDFTGGWAMAVGVLAKSGDTSRTGKGGLLLERYIKRQIWEQWDTDLQSFMLTISVVDTVTPALAQSLSGKKDSGALLERLCAANTFIARMGNGGYRCHDLFLDFLRQRLADSGLDLPAIYQAAARHYLQEGEQLAARRFAIRSGDMDVIMESMHQFSQYSNPSLDEYVLFFRMFNADTLPEEICEAHPFLYATHLYICYLSGRAKEMEYFLDKMYQHLNTIATKYPQFLEMVILELSLDHRVPFSKQMESFSALPAITHKSETLQGASVTVQMPFLHRSNRDYYELADPVVLEKLSGSFALLLKEHYEITKPCLQAGLLLEKDKPQQALDYAKQAVALTKTITSPEFVFAAYMHLAAVYAAQGNTTSLRETLELAAQAMDGSGAGYLRPNLLAYTTRLRLMDGDKRVALDWLRQFFVTVKEPVALYKIFQGFTTARAYLVLGEAEKAEALIEQLRNLGADFGRPLDAAEAGVLNAALQWALQKRKEAVEGLTNVLRSLQPHGFVRVVADEGAAVLPILKKINTLVQSEQYDGALDKAYVNTVYLAAYATSRLYKGVTSGMNLKPVKLSKQQKQVLEYRAKGMTVADIMAETGLSMNTIKSHTRIAYEKLDVTNAMDAVLKARELGLIE